MTQKDKKLMLQECCCTKNNFIDEFYYCRRIKENVRTF